MTRRYLFLITFFFFIFQFCVLKADSNLFPENETSLYLNFGGSTSLEPTSNEWNTGYSGGVGVGLGLSRIFSFIFDANYYYFPINRAIPSTYGDISDLIFLTNGKFRFIPQDNPVVPYGMLGLGVDFYDEPAFQYGGSGAALAILAAIGMDIRLSPKTAIFLQYGITAIANKAYAANSGFDLVTFKMGLKLNL